MKALLFKEIRENVRLAALGLVIHILLLVVQYRNYVAYPESLSQPLASGDLLWSTLWFGGIFGAVLGWLQIHSERRPDLWAFLLHRPMTRTQIFLAKTLAGLGLYAGVLGLPLLGFIAWARWPGHVSAPFEMIMLRPVAAAILSGLMFYFAGMLTGLRQARWYASRALALGMGLVFSVLMLVRPAWWEGFLCVLIGILILLVAVWGAFQTHGYYHRQPVWGKACLTFAMMLGCGLLAVVSAVLLSNLFPESDRSVPWARYVMTSEGVVCKVTEGPGGKSEIQDLNGKPLLDAKTQKEVELADFNRRTRRVSSLGLESEMDARPREWLYADLSVAPGWYKTADTAWYYWKRYGRLVAYDIPTRRYLGSLGPNGFSQDPSGGGSQFTNSAAHGSRSLASTATTLYHLDLQERTVKALFTTTADDPVRSSLEVRFEKDGAEQRYVVVATTHSIHLLKPNGEPLWKVPYDSQDRAYGHLEIHFLDAPGQYALWLTPTGSESQPNTRNLPIHVIWVAQQQGILKTTDLPRLARPQPRIQPQEIFSSAVTPPIILQALRRFVPGFNPNGLPRELLLPSWIGALVVCLPIGVWLGRRYRLPLPALAGWAAFLALFGVPGLLAFLSVQEWPARVPCPNCKRARMVDREHCEHCGAEFGPPEKSGTEIFAPLVKAS